MKLLLLSLSAKQKCDWPVKRLGRMSSLDVLGTILQGVLHKVMHSVNTHLARYFSSTMNCVAANT